MTDIYKIAGKVLDCYDDPEFISHPLTQQRLGKDILDSVELARLPDTAFAVKIASKQKQHRRYPVYNPVITSISCQYFEAAKDTMPEEIEKAAGYHLKAACLTHGIAVPEYLKKYEQVPFLVLNVSAKTDLNTLEQEKVASSYEEQLWFRMPSLDPEERSRAADDFCKVAGYDAITKRIIWDYVPKPVVGPNLIPALDDRYELLKAAGQDILIRMLEEIESISDSANTQTIVEHLVSLDKMAGFDRRYAGGFTDPYLAVYGGHDMPLAIEERQKDQIDMQKFAGPVDPQTGTPVDDQISKQMTTAQHLAALQRLYPKGSPEYLRKSANPATPEVEKKYGGNYIKARDMHFASKSVSK